MTSVAAGISQSNLRPLDLRCAFKLSSATVAVHQRGLTPKVGDQICQLIQRGNVLDHLELYIDNLEHYSGFGERPVNSDWIGELLCQVLIQGAVESTEFSIRSSFATHPTRLSTALAVAQDTKQVTIKMDYYDSEDIDNWTWECVAFGLFSKHAQFRSGISHVALDNVCIYPVEVEAILKLLYAENPLIYFLQRLHSMQNEVEETRGDVTSAKQVALKKGTTVTMLDMYASNWYPHTPRVCQLCIRAGKK